jgi:hypothetical protein
VLGDDAEVPVGEVDGHRPVSAHEEGAEHVQRAQALQPGQGLQVVRLRRGARGARAALGAWSRVGPSPGARGVSSARGRRCSSGGARARRTCISLRPGTACLLSSLSLTRPVHAPTACIAAAWCAGNWRRARWLRLASSGRQETSMPPSMQSSDRWVRLVGR